MKYFSLITFLLIQSLVISQAQDNKQLLIEQFSAINQHKLNFEENKGQIIDSNGEPQSDILYTLKDNGITLYFKSDRIIYEWRQIVNLIDEPTNVSEATGLPISPNKELSKFTKPNPFTYQTFRTEMKWEGANNLTEIIAEDPENSFNNYYKNGSQILNVKSYNKLTYKNLYPNIDALYYIKDGKLKYDLILNSGSNINDVVIAYAGNSTVQLKNGKVKVVTALGDIEEQEPVAFLESGELLEIKYIIDKKKRIKFNIQNYDPNSKIIIDPEIIWSTYYGGSGGESVYGLCTDTQNNVYITGITSSTSAISSNGFQNSINGEYDAYVAKFNSDGIRLWGTYYGGSNIEYSYDVKTDQNGNVYFTGETNSASGIATNSHQNTFGGNSDGFLVKLNNNGERIWATYYGGSGIEEGVSIAVDNNQNILLSGTTNSSNNIAFNGHQNSLASINYDSYLVKFNNDGVRQWGTYYGGSEGEGTYAITTDNNNNIYLAGATSSSSNIASSGHQNNYGGGSSDGYLVKFNSSGVRQWASYYGGAGDFEFSRALITDSQNNVYMAGTTRSSTNIASSTGAHQSIYGGDYDAFLAKFNSNGSRLWATYYGGINLDYGESVTLDIDENVFLSGYSESASDIAINGFQNVYAGGIDAFIVKFNSSGVRQWGTYYGGSGNDQSYDIVSDALGNFYVSGFTRSSSNIALEGHQNVYGGNNDSFLFKFRDILLPPTLFCTTSNLSQGRKELAATSIGNKVLFAGGEIAGSTFSSVVDIYNSTTNSWSTANLSQARYDLAGTAVGDVAIFAGGYTGLVTNRVDIYNNLTETWTTSSLSEARNGLKATSVGTKALFAGGYNAASVVTNTVDIYNSLTDSWSTASLSTPRAGLAAATAGNKAFFAGGIGTGLSNVVDIYDNNTNTWTTALLQLQRAWLAAASVGTKVFFAGGSTSSGGESNLVEIYDISNNTWTTAQLSQARTQLTAVSLGSKVYFAGGFSQNSPSNVVDIYDNQTNKWSTSTLSVARWHLASASVGSKVLFGGGLAVQGSLLIYSDVVDICTESQAPSITTFSPTTGPIGTVVTITGSNFSTTPASNTVTFNGTNAVVTASTATSITTTVPAGATTGPILVTVGGITATSSTNFTVTQGHTITGFNPSSGAVGATVTITGTNFSTTPSNNIVSFNGSNAVVTASTSTSITTSVPSGATTGPISVTINGTTVTSGISFTVLATPTVLSFTPTSGSIGAVVTITGTNFSSTPANNIVRFNGTAATVTSTSTTTLIVTVPAGATTGLISVTTAGVTVTSQNNFTVLGSPTITSLNPTCGTVGTSVIITGTNFSATPANNVVKFNGTTSVVTSSTTTSITTTAPANASTGPITVTVNGVTITSPSNFTIIQPPTITGFTPAFGSAGTIVTITGSNFSVIPSENIVRFNGIIATVTAATTNSLTTTIPAGVTTGSISVTICGSTATSSSNITIDTTPPFIVVDNTGAEVIQGSSHLITAQISDPESGVSNANVIYRSVTEGEATKTMSLTKSGDNWEFTVPSSEIGELGIEYKLNATNGVGLQFTSPAFKLVKVRIPPDGLTIPYSSFGTTLSSYEIFSIPLDLDNSTVGAIFDELPPLERPKWRIFNYDISTDKTTELTTSSQIKAGHSYWLIIRNDPKMPIRTGTGKTVNAPFTLQLQAGWNQIGNPYNFDISWNDVTAANTGLPVSLRVYNRSIKNFENSSTLKRMEGGFINVNSAMTLTFPVKKNTGGRIKGDYVSLKNPIDQANWEVDFTIQQGDMYNVIGGFGMREEAEAGFDIYDGFAMPRLEEFLEIAHTKKTNNYSFSKDVVPSNSEYTWEYEINSSDNSSTATLSWDNSYFGNNSMELFLIDNRRNIWIDMKQHSSYNFTPQSGFKVLYGQNISLSKEIPNSEPQILGASPNPSSGPIRLHVFIPSWKNSYPVKIDLISTMGTTITEIFNGSLNSGYQEVEWLNDNRVSSGMYLIQMRCEGKTSTLKVIIN